MASALALADLAERKLDVRSARELLVRGNFGPSDTSELTSELGTLEVISGKRSRARQLFSQSLERPNDNTLAQARWAFDELQLDLDFEGKATNGAFEAQLRAHVKNGEWDAAYLAGIWWQRDQSFSQAAALSTSFVAAIGLENYEAALQAAKIGMRANPTDGGLRNNAAFAAAQLGRLTEAESYLAVATATDDVDQVHTVEATRGLIAFRSGKVIAGREYYKSARDGFRSLGLPYQNVMALLHWATEEVRIHSASAIELVKAAADAVARYPTAEGQLLLVRLQEKTAIE